MLRARQNVLFSMGVGLLIVYSSTVVLGQGNLPEYQACQDEKTPPDVRIFSCSRIHGDASLPANLRAGALRSRGSAYRLKGDFDRAISDLGEAIRIDPNDAANYEVRALIYRTRARPTRGRPTIDVAMFDRAIDDYTASLRLSPQSARLYLLRGGALSEKGDYGGAVLDYTEAIRLSPTAGAYNARGDANNARGNFDGAIVDFSAAIRLGGINFAYFLGRSGAYSGKNGHGRALEELREALRLSPGTFNVTMARIFLKAGKADQALATANAAIEKSSNYPFSYEGRAVVYEALGRKENAITDYQKALALGSNLSVFYLQDSREALKRLGSTP